MKSDVVAEREAVRLQLAAERELVRREFSRWFSSGKPLSAWEGVRKWHVRALLFGMRGRK